MVASTCSPPRACAQSSSSNRPVNASSRKARTAASSAPERSAVGAVRRRRSGAGTGPVKLRTLTRVTLHAAVLGFGVVALLVTLTQGLDTALVLRAALTRGRRDAFAAALGVVGGLGTWGVAAAVGVSALLAASTVAYDALRLVGAGYMVWLGGRMLWRGV